MAHTKCLEQALIEAEILARRGDMIGAKRRIEEYHGIQIPEAELAPLRDGDTIREDSSPLRPLRDRLIRYGENVRRVEDIRNRQAARKALEEALAASSA